MLEGQATHFKNYCKQTPNRGCCKIRGMLAIPERICCLWRKLYNAIMKTYKPVGISRVNTTIYVNKGIYKEHGRGMRNMLRLRRQAERGSFDVRKYFSTILSFCLCFKGRISH